jgi:hypothetical protein
LHHDLGPKLEIISSTLVFLKVFLSFDGIITEEIREAGIKKWWWKRRRSQNAFLSHKALLSQARPRRRLLAHATLGARASVHPRHLDDGGRGISGLHKQLLKPDKRFTKLSEGRMKPRHRVELPLDGEGNEKL